MANLNGNPNIVAAGAARRFTTSNQPKKRGRLPSKLKKFIKENAISKSDVDKIFTNLIFASTIEELQEMIKPGKKEKLPVIVVLLISAFIADMNKGTLHEVNTVLDRIYGKASQQVEISESASDIPSDPAERRAMAEQIKRELAARQEKNGDE